MSGELEVDIDHEQWNLIRRLAAAWVNGRQLFTARPDQNGWVIDHPNLMQSLNASVFDMQTLGNLDLIRSAQSESNGSVAFGVTPRGQRAAASSGPNQWQPTKRPLALQEVVLLGDLLKAMESTNPPTPIRITGSGNRIMQVEHSGFENGRAAIVLDALANLEAWSYVRRDMQRPFRNDRPWGLLSVTHEGKRFMEPSSQVASEPQTPQAITNYNSIFNGGSHNIAQGSSQVSQAVNMNQPAGDLDALLSRLRDLRLPEETLDELMVAIEADTDESGHPQWGARLRTWIGNLCSAIFVEGVASGIVNNSSDIPHVIEEVHKAISSYVG